VKKLLKIQKSEKTQTKKVLGAFKILFYNVFCFANFQISSLSVFCAGPPDKLAEAFYTMRIKNRFSGLRKHYHGQKDVSSRDCLHFHYWFDCYRFADHISCLNFLSDRHVSIREAQGEKIKIPARVPE